MKKGAIIFGGILSVILVASLVAAQNMPAPMPNLPIGPEDAAISGGAVTSGANIAKAFQPLIDLFAGLFQGLAGALNAVTGNTDIGQFVFAKFIIFLILAYVLAIPAKKLTGGSDTVGWIVSLLVSMLGVYFLPESVLRMLVVPYNALAVSIVLTGAILLGFWFFERYTRTIRKIGWMLMLIAITGLYLYNMATYNGLNSGIQLAYAVGFLASLVLFFLDTPINNFFNRMKIEKEDQAQAYAKYTSLQTEYEKYGDLIADAIAHGNVKAVPALEKKRKNIESAMAAITARL